MASHLGSKSVKSVPVIRDIQNRSSGNNKTFTSTRLMGNTAGPQRCILPHSHKSQVKEVPKALFEQSNVSSLCSTFRLGHSPIGVHQSGQGSETHGTDKGYPNRPVPRLVTQSPVPGNLPTEYLDPLGPVPLTGLGCKHEEVDTSARFRFCWVTV